MLLMGVVVALLLEGQNAVPMGKPVLQEFKQDLTVSREFVKKLARQVDLNNAVTGELGVAGNEQKEERAEEYDVYGNSSTAVRSILYPIFDASDVYRSYRLESCITLDTTSTI